MDTKNADKLLRKTKDNYDAFADSFSQTRDYIPTQMERLLIGRVHPGDNVLDVGCGNGRYYPIFLQKEVEYHGVDISAKLINIAKQKYPKGDFAVGDALFLPFKNNEFDLFFSVAVLHHIPSREYRKRFFLEARRVLKPGGRIFVMVWDLRFRSMIKVKNWRRVKGFSVGAGQKPWSGWKNLISAIFLFLGKNNTSVTSIASASANWKTGPAERFRNRRKRNLQSRPPGSQSLHCCQKMRKIEWFGFIACVFCV